MHRLFLSILFLSSLGFAGPVEDTLRSLIEDSIVGDDELMLLIESIDGDAPKNPICDEAASTSIEHQFAQEDLDAVMQSDDVDWDAVREWANEQLDESKRVEKKRQEKREETRGTREIEGKPVLLSTSSGMMCAVASGYQLKCWTGENKNFEVASDPGFVKQVFMREGMDFSVHVILSDDSHRCFLGIYADKSACRDSQFDFKVSHIAAGASNICALDLKNEVRCGKGKPKVLEGVGSVKKLISGGKHFCVLTSDDQPICWGFPFDEGGGFHQVVENWNRVVDIEAGRDGICAILRDETVVCTGWLRGGMSKGDSLTINPEFKIQSMHVGNTALYALDESGRPHWWSFEHPAEHRTFKSNERYIGFSGGSGATCLILENRQVNCLDADILRAGDPSFLDKFAVVNTEIEEMPSYGFLEKLGTHLLAWLPL